MATAFELAWPYGLPQIMSSYAFELFNVGPPMYSNETLISPSIKNDDSCGNGYVCEHRWRQIYNMVLFRNAVRDAKVENWWDNGNNQIAFSRGNVGFIVINGENNQPLNVNLQTGLPSGTYCDIVSGQRCEKFCTGSSVIVGADGKANFNLQVGAADGFIAIYLNSKIPNS
jgi:alpha-amylase